MGRQLRSSPSRPSPSTTPGDETWQENLARWLDRAVDFIVGADPIPDYIEPDEHRRRCLARTGARARGRTDPDPAARRARRHPGDQRRRAGRPDRRDAADHAQRARHHRQACAPRAATLGIVGRGLRCSSRSCSRCILARTIVQPLRTLVPRSDPGAAGARPRRSRCRACPSARDEIGLLARAVSDMTAALRQRIDAVESFAADVAHEIKNPLASLRSAIEFARQGRGSGPARAADRDRRARRAADRPAGDRDLRSQPDRRRTEPRDVRAGRSRRAGRQRGRPARSARRERRDSRSSLERARRLERWSWACRCGSNG